MQVCARALLAACMHSGHHAAACAAAAAAHQEVLEGLVVGDDAVVDDHPLVVVTRGVRVGVDGCGAAVRRPTRVPNRCLCVQHLCASPIRSVEMSPLTGSREAAPTAGRLGRWQVRSWQWLAGFRTKCRSQHLIAGADGVVVDAGIGELCEHIHLAGGLGDHQLLGHAVDAHARAVIPAVCGASSALKTRRVRCVQQIAGSRAARTGRCLPRRPKAGAQV